MEPDNDIVTTSPEPTRTQSVKHPMVDVEAQ